MCSSVTWVCTSYGHDKSLGSEFVGNLSSIPSPLQPSPQANEVPLAHGTCRGLDVFTPYKPTYLREVSLGFSFCSLLSCGGGK